jgi:formylglycine-generating enzyme required for sulfatase activity
VGYVTPAQAREFCSVLTERFDGQPIVRLPFDDEWGHALLTGRGRVPSAHPGLCAYDAATGEADLDRSAANFESDEGAFFPPGHKDGFGRHAPVGSYAPSRWGLYDMLGNVREWVIRREDYQPVTKGGSFLESVVDVSIQRDPRIDFEVALDTRTAYEDNGFRIVVLQP